jgi:MoxR-like ATPase
VTTSTEGAMNGGVFANLDEVEPRLAEQNYVSDRKLATVVFLATRLNKPILAEGPAGVGKTELAMSLARALDRALIRLQCYEGLDEAKALYEWEYSKQLLYTQVLREKIGEVLGPTEGLREAAKVLREREDVFFSENFLVERPILQAIRSERPPVLLIDEIDRADEEFEAFLLEFLADYQVSIPEIGTVKAEHPPIVVLTSNRTRELSEALKRRCLHLQIDYPSPEVELKIVRLKAPGIGDALAQQLVGTIQQIRALDLRKAPSIGETIDWAQSLAVLGAPQLSKELIEETISVIAKYDRDADKILAAVRGTGGRTALQQRHDEAHDSIWTRHANTLEERHGNVHGTGSRAHGSHSHGPHSHGSHSH